MKASILLIAMAANFTVSSLVLASPNPHRFPKYREELTGVGNCQEAHQTHREHARLLAVDHCNTEHQQQPVGRFEYKPLRCRRVVRGGEEQRTHAVYQVEGAVRFLCGAASR